ncbi:chemotaxis protein CheR [Thermoanaerobacterium sp. PSU-2]|uniref:CheR family methyltransferase n=1 Tax=Thermoanaerobacterium sp. PSU-2 TaxID=1930849 RepID=UPI000A15DE41|nr:protein-glutamate O-methyltransferase CheR [Thermoanaerobacterium sp. PSU-2]ORX24161.1 chemotaxis protein CheR [Thermoanaerobacterium sp. PSU-2]
MNYDEFLQKIFNLTGIDLSLYKEKQMKRRVDSFIANNNCKNYDVFYEILTKDTKIYREFLKYITINVTEFFRNLEQWMILKNEILPKIIKKNMKIWSAACSTGEEAYSLAMLLSDFIDLREINIIATDIDDVVLEKAKKGIYNNKSIEKIPEEYMKYFTKLDENNFVISEELRKNIVFKKHNLLLDKYPDSVDLIVCRNVLIYFNDKAKEEIYKKFYSSLSSNGILFVGSTEQIIFPYKYNFAPIKTFFYKKISK